MFADVCPDRLHYPTAIAYRPMERTGLRARKTGSQKLKWLSSVLAKHCATLRCQFDLFAEYVAEAERVGTEDYHLYEWTKATIEDPIKKAKYVKSFSLYVDDREVYAKETADALEADLMPLAEGGQIKKLSKYDSNPANRP